MNYAVRITREYSQLLSYIPRIALVCEKMVVYEHNENVSRVHIHAHIWGCSQTDDTLKNWLSQTLGVKVNKSDISFKQQYKPKGSTQSMPIDDGNISYMSKGKYNPVYVKGYTNEEIEELKAKGFDKKDDSYKAKKNSSDEGLYNAFIEYVGSEFTGYEIPIDKLRALAFSFCRKEVGHCLNANFMNKRNMLLRTYIYDFNSAVTGEIDNSIIFKNWI